MRCYFPHSFSSSNFRWFNFLLDIYFRGTLSWGSKSSLNAWGTSSLSPRTESGPGSPSHLSNRPSSGGSVTRPSTADSNKAHDSSSSVAWDSNSRPSSASGVFPSNQPSVALQRPHSADTRPGSSQLSRFAEPVSETSATWGQHVAPEKLVWFFPLKSSLIFIGTLLSIFFYPYICEAPCHSSLTSLVLSYNKHTASSYVFGTVNGNYFLGLMIDIQSR